MKYNDLINELLDLFDKNDDIKNIKRLKKKLMLDEKLMADIKYYRFFKTVDTKKKLYENKDYLEYLQSETNINLLIKDIKSKFDVFHNRKCYHESN